MIINIERYKAILTDKEQLRILDDLHTSAKKQGHWMWWAFPQKVSTDKKDMVSHNTWHYRIKPAEVMLFINHFRAYYLLALTILSERIMKEGLDLKKYFGNVDYKKFVSHIQTFHENFIPNRKNKKIGECLEMIFRITNNSSH